MQRTTAANVLAMAALTAGLAACDTSTPQMRADGAAMTMEEDDAALDEAGTETCVAAGGQCVQSAVCADIQVGPACPSGTTCCLHVVCADATVRLFQASNYERSCTRDSDCIAVAVGNACTCELTCGGKKAAINRAAEPQYETDLFNFQPLPCSCLRPPPPPADAAVACCVGGMCQMTPGCSAGPVFDAASAADASAMDAADASARTRAAVE